MALRSFASATCYFFRNKHLTFCNNILHARGIVSALHIPGSSSKAAVSIITPSFDHIDLMINTQLEQVERDLLARESKFPLSSLIEEWNRMTTIRSQREALEEQRVNISQSIKELAKDKTSEIQQLKEEGKRLRTQLKDLTPIWWEVEEKAVNLALCLPNKLHPETPIKEVHQTHGQLKKSDAQICKELISNAHRVVGHSPTAFYSLGSYAELELNWLRDSNRYWIDNGFHPMSPPDFVKSVIVDGCGMSFRDSSQVLSLSSFQDHGSLESANALHLVGAGSLPAIVAFLCKNVIEDPYPLRLVSMGRTYRPVSEKVNEEALNTVQASSIQLMTVMENNPSSLYNECIGMQQKIEQQLTKLNVHFRTNILAAKNLERWEQYRVAFELFSSSAGKYVEVASISIGM